MSNNSDTIGNLFRICSLRLFRKHLNIYMTLEPISSFEVHQFRDCILLIAEIVKGIKLSLCYITGTNLINRIITVCVSKVTG